MITLVFLNVTAVILETEASIYEPFKMYFDGLELFSVVVFSLEFLMRLWTCREDPRFQDGWRGLGRFLTQPMAIVDLLSIVPFFLPMLGLDLRTFRAFGLLRILRVAKLGRYYTSLNLIKQVFLSKKEELIVITVLMSVFLIISASILYFCEHTVQPKTFSSIPATMWWAIVTLTTVGYGDMYPATPLGKFFAGVIALIGIGMFALPTGILGAGFVEAVQKSKTESENSCCPHCGKELPSA
jgi:voltage-gated potassium channel